MATRTYIVQVALADLAEHYADGVAEPDLMIADTLFTTGERVRDVTGYRDGYQIHTLDGHARPGVEFYTHDATEWFVTTDRRIRNLGV